MAISSIEQTQEARELQQAIAVQKMNAQERASWLRQELDAAQANAKFFMSRFPQGSPAMSFASMAEKNRYDEARGLHDALEHSLVAETRHAASAH